MIQVAMGPGEKGWDAGGGSLLRNNGYTRAVSNTYKLFRNPCATLKSDLHKSLECLTEFVNAPALLGTAVGAATAPCAMRTGPKQGRHFLGPAAGPAAHTWSPSCFSRASWAHAVCLLSA